MYRNFQKKFCKLLLAPLSFVVKLVLLALPCIVDIKSLFCLEYIYALSALIQSFLGIHTFFKRDKLLINS